MSKSKELPPRIWAIQKPEAEFCKVIASFSDWNSHYGTPREYISLDEHESLLKEMVEELSKCPNESWECVKIQRRLESQLSAEQEKVRVLREAIAEIRDNWPHAEHCAGKTQTTGRNDWSKCDCPWGISNKALASLPADKDATNGGVGK